MTLAGLIDRYCSQTGQPPIQSDDLYDFMTALYVTQKLDGSNYKELLQELEARGAHKPLYTDNALSELSVSS
jgi:hypothetical protein